MSINDLYNHMSGIGAYDPLYEMESQLIQQHMTKQMEAVYREIGMRDNPLGKPPTTLPITQPEPNKVLLLLGEDE